MIFSTNPGPGCTKDKKWDDPREGGEGPLPRDWAHYRGMYLHGDKVVLSYTIGDCDVLEMPTCVKSDHSVAVIRTFKFGPSTREQRVALFDVLKDDKIRAYPLFPDRKGPSVLDIERENSRLVFMVDGVPRSVGHSWSHIQPCTLHVPAHNDDLVIVAVLAKVAVGKSVADELGPVWRGTLRVDPLIKGGPLRWKDAIETKAAVAHDGKFPYVVDDIALPTENPWHTPIRPGGFDFFPDGRAAVCTWDGDVWIVSGLDDKLDKVRWKRFAAGLQQPLGLRIIDGYIYTAGRDQITKLHDLNGDGEADFYENFNNDAPLTLQRHEFVMDLQTDKAGNLYFGRSGHYVAATGGANCCVYKLTPDGKKLDVFARGFREPNGLSVGADGTMIVGDNEGNGVPQTPIYRLREGAFYGYRPSKSEELSTKGAKWEFTQKPIVWLPTNVDSSAGSQVWVPDDRFGPLKGQILHTSYGKSALFSLLIDRKAEPWQGAVWKWPLAFTSGIMRARFHPTDGQLYLCGLRGWGTNAVKDGQFCRVRYTGKSLPMPVGFEVVHGGLQVTFSGPLDRATAEDEDNWAGDWSNAFGKNGAPSKAKQDMPIGKVQLSADRKTATIRLEKLQTAANFTLQYRLKAADGAPVTGELHGTIHRVP
jgi:glucose/arabinose dehydrogenase